MVSFFGKRRAELLADISCRQAEEHGNNVLNAWHIARSVSRHRDAEKRPQPWGAPDGGAVCQRTGNGGPHRTLRTQPLRVQCGGMVRVVRERAHRALLEDSQRAGAGCQRRESRQGRNMAVFTCVAMSEKRAAVNTAEAGEHGMRGVAVDERKAKT